MEAVLIGMPITLSHVVAVARRGARLELAPAARERVSLARALVDRLVERREPVYGVTTGFGKFSDVPISPAETETLQQNLIMSHAAGVGPPLEIDVVRAAIMLRAHALAQGHSGIRPATLQLLLELANRGVHPVIPSQGSLGASGDLAPLAHLALVLIGRGEAWFEQRRLPGAAALRAAGLEPVTLGAKEGLALINGTQVMTATGALALADAQTLLTSADIIAALSVEVLGGITEAFDPRVQALRRHAGQELAAANLRRLLTGSSLTTRPGEVRVQDPYTLRCIPQVHGASRSALDHVATVLGWELDAVTDNPLIFPAEGEVVSGGNFHGQPVALALDYLAIAVAELAGISERRTERLLNPELSGLPAFLTNRGGLCSGLMIAQYTAAALVSENKVLAHPASVDSIPTSANQEDHVSMGAISARKARQVTANCARVLAVELLSAAQAAEFWGAGGLAPATRAAYAALRKQVPPLDRDRELHSDIETATELILGGELTAAATAVAGPLH